RVQDRGMTREPDEREGFSPRDLGALKTRQGAVDSRASPPMPARPGRGPGHAGALGDPGPRWLRAGAWNWGDGVRASGDKGAGRRLWAIWRMVSQHAAHSGEERPQHSGHSASWWNRMPSCPNVMITLARQPSWACCRELHSVRRGAVATVISSRPGAGGWSA